MNTRYLLLQVLVIAAVDIGFIALALFPDRALATWFRGLRVVPIVNTPGGLRAAAAVGFLLLTSMLAVAINAWLHIRSGGR